MHWELCRFLINSLDKVNTFTENPSIFDVVANESLLQGVAPAFKHIIKVLAEKTPTYNQLYDYVDELCLCFHTVLQYYYLKNYGASFAEHFYDLKRVPAGAKANINTKNTSLPPNLLWKSLFCLTLPSYLYQLLLKYYTALEREPQSNKKDDKLNFYFRVIWPKVYFSAQILSFYYLLRYIGGSMRVHSPLLHLSGTVLSYISDEDLEYFETFKQLMPVKNVKSFKDFVQFSFSCLGSGVRLSLECGAFVLQFLEWFYSSDSVGEISLENSRVPPPPHYQKEKSTEKGGIQILKKKLCPLCCRRRKQDTVLSTSGYVFCYPCILPHLRENKSCPITGYPASSKQLIRIYEE